MNFSQRTSMCAGYLFHQLSIGAPNGKPGKYLRSAGLSYPLQLSYRPGGENLNRGKGNFFNKKSGGPGRVRRGKGYLMTSTSWVRRSTLYRCCWSRLMR